MNPVYPEALVVTGSDAGPFTGGAPKGLLHTTEGGSFAGALSVYRDRGFWPHFTCSFERNRFDIWQHLDVTRTGKALEHPAGTPPTNSDHVVQIEIVGRAADAPHFPVAYLDGIARWMRWVERTTGVIRRPLASFVPGAPRLTAQAWHEGSGWCGHMHVPNNSHTDPGAIDIAYLLNAAAPTPAPDQPVHDYPEDTVRTKLVSIGPLGPDGNGYNVWDPGFGRGPVPVGEPCQQGPRPAPAADNGYWVEQAHTKIRCAPEETHLVVSVVGGPPGGTILCWVSAA